MNALVVVTAVDLEALVSRAVRTATEPLRSVPAPSPEPARPAQEPLFTVPEVAQRIRANAGTVREYIHEGRLIASRPSRHYLVKESDLERFLSARAEAAARKAEPPQVDDEAARLLSRMRK